MWAAERDVFGVAQEHMSMLSWQILFALFQQKSLPQVVVALRL